MKRAFEVKGKAFFHISKGLSIAKNCLRPESAPVKELQNRILGVIFPWSLSCLNFL